MPIVSPQGSSMDDLDSAAAQFEEDVARIAIFTNGDETTDYITADGRAVPSLSKVVANVNDMIAPDLAAIDAAVTASQSAASAAGQSASTAAASAGTAQTDAANAQAAAIATQADAIATADDAARAEASKDAASTARDEAVNAQANVQQNAEAAGSAAGRAAESETSAASAAAQVALDLQAVEELATEAAGNAVAAGQSETLAAQSATAAAESATAAGKSATQAAASAASINVGKVLIETQGPTNVANVFANLTGYDVYELVFDGLLPTNNLQDLAIHFSYDNGATWATTQQYQFSYLFSTVANNNAVASGVAASNNILLWGQCSNVAISPFWSSYEGTIRFFNFHRSTVPPSAQFDVSGVGSGSQAYGNLRGAGRLLALPGTPINAFRIFCGSAGFSRGSLSLYGLTKGQP
jgi:hypothetical protein